MLTLVFLSIAARSSLTLPSPERLSPKEVVQGLASIGLPFRSLDENGLVGRVERDGTTLSVSMAASGQTEDQGAAPQVVGLCFEIEIPVGEDIPLHAAERSGRFFLPLPRLVAIPHLGQTVTLLQDIDLQEGFDPLRIAGILDRFWRDGTEYARAHGGRFAAAPARDWRRLPLRDDLVMDRSDLVSLDRAAASWGLARPKGFAPYPLWGAIQVAVDGRTVAVSERSHGEGPANGSYTFGTVLHLDRPVVKQRWSALDAKRPTWAEFYPQNEGTLGVFEKVDVTRGVALRDFRKLLSAFVAKSERLRVGLNAVP